ncbi:hypothetical protein [Paenibacillus koleovorans]|uniref:hypothetical protein n=1 Tax=Paenibacillus koleovorans TaxID=121608 RepID=UPI000FD9C56D|nr:hypothetical protein [Paenibacillus koleovorans]
MELISIAFSMGPPISVEVSSVRQVCRFHRISLHPEYKLAICSLLGDGDEPFEHDVQPVTIQSLWDRMRSRFEH